MDIRKFFGGKALDNQQPGHDKNSKRQAETEPPQEKKKAKIEGEQNKRHVENTLSKTKKAAILQVENGRQQNNNNKKKDTQVSKTENERDEGLIDGYGSEKETTIKGNRNQQTKNKDVKKQETKNTEFKNKETNNNKKQGGRKPKRKSVLIDSESEDIQDQSDYEPDLQEEKQTQSENVVSSTLKSEEKDEDLEIIQSNKQNKPSLTRRRNNGSNDKKNDNFGNNGSDEVYNNGSNNNIKDDSKRGQQSKSKREPVKQKAQTPKKEISLQDQYKQEFNQGNPKNVTGMSMSEGAEEAINVVDEAIKQLPDESQVKFTILEKQENNYYQGGDNMTPPKLGLKDVPIGHPDCLTNKAFVISGILESLQRNDAENLIKRHGGRVTTAVSGKTDFLICGQNTGNSKYKSAKEKKTKIIDEDGLFFLIKSTQNLIKQKEDPGVVGLVKSSQDQQSQQQASKVMPNKKNVKQQDNISLQKTNLGKHEDAQKTQKRKKTSELWVDKFKPKTSQDLVGNNQAIQNLKVWLSSWHENQATGEGAQISSRGKQKDATKKAILLSGPPGIGKTSSAHIIARELGYNAIEVNASDTRNKADSKTNQNKGIAGKQSNIIRELVTNSTIKFSYKESQQQDIERTVLIMDEVDGMSAGDRGGVTELIQLIHSSKMPIICICNDKYNQKLRSLRNHCLEMDYRKPTKQQISKRLLLICNIEKLSINQATIESICEQGDCDVRLILGQLQLIKLKQDVFGYDDAKGKMKAGKDSAMSPFEASRKLLSLEQMNLSLADKIDMVFQDMDLVPLLVQENYLNHKPMIAQSDDQKLKCIAKASDSFSLGDVANNQIRKHGNWNLMPFYALAGTVIPSTYMRGMRDIFNLYPGEANFPRFSAWLGNNSSQGKNYRQLNDLLTVLRASNNFQGGRKETRLEYVNAFNKYFVQQIKQAEDAEDLENAVNTMKEYCITKDDYDFIMSVTSFKSKATWNQDLTKDVPTKIKSSFTRQVNQNIVPRCSTMVNDFKKSKSKASAPQQTQGEMEGEGTLAEAEKVQEEDEPQDLDANDEETTRKLQNKKGMTFQSRDINSKKGKKSGSSQQKKGSNKQTSGKGIKK